MVKEISKQREKDGGGGVADLMVQKDPATNKDHLKITYSLSCPPFPYALMC